MRRILFFAALTTSVANVWAADINIGPFCMSGVVSKSDPTDLSFSNGIQWMRVDYSYRTSKSPATLVIFSAPVSHDPNAPPDCAQLRKEATKQGIAIILDGTIERLDMTARVGIGAPGNRFWIEPKPQGSLAVTMRRVESGLQPVGGGVLDLRGSKLWIRSVDQLLSTPAGISGELEVEAYDRPITGAKIRLQGGASATATLRQRQPNDENIVLRVDTATGTTKLWRANMFARDVAIHDGGLEVSTVRVEKFVGKASALSISAGGGELTGALTGFSGTAGNLLGGGPAFRFATNALEISKANLAGKVVQGDAEFALSGIRASDVVAKASALSLNAGQNTLAIGASAASVSDLSADAISADVQWQKPSIRGLPLGVPDGYGKTLQLKLQGEPASPRLSGSLLAGAFSLSGVRITRDLALRFGPAASGLAVDIPIDLKTSGVGGEVELSDYDQKTVVRADLADLRLKAVLHLDLDDPVEKSTFDIPAGGIEVGLSAAVSLTPWLAGTKPGFGKVGVKLGNSEPVTLKHTKPVGFFDLSSDIIVLANPVMRFGEGAQARRASLTLNSVGNAAFTYGADDRKLVTQKARFETKSPTMFGMLDPGGTVDIGGTIVAEPKVSVDKLLIELDRKKDVRVTEAETIIISGSTYDHPRRERSETAFSGQQAAPFSVHKLVGKPEFNDTSITIREIEANTVSFALSNASMTLGESLVLSKSNLAISADQIRSVDEVQKKADGTDDTDPTGNVIRNRRLYLKNLNVAANGKLKESEFSDSMQLDVPPDVKNLSLSASGRSDQLNGSGAFSVSEFSGRFQSEVEFQFACKGGGHPKAPTEARFTTLGTPGGAIQLRINNGKFAAEGLLAGLNILYKGDTARECDSDSISNVISQTLLNYRFGAMAPISSG